MANVRGTHDHHAIFAPAGDRQIHVVAGAFDQSRVDLHAQHRFGDDARVAHAHVQACIRMPLQERGRQGRDEVVTDGRAGTDPQVDRCRRKRLARHRPAELTFDAPGPFDQHAHTGDQRAAPAVEHQALADTIKERCLKQVLQFIQCTTRGGL